MAAVRRVLIIKLSAFGDIIHALPVASALKATYPHIEITWAVEEAYAPLVAGNPTIDHILLLPKVGSRQLRSARFHRDLFSRLRDVRRREFDLTLDLQGLFKSAVVAASSGARVRLAYHWTREAASLFEKAVPREPGSVHIVDQYLDVARFLGADVQHPQFPFAISEEDVASADRMLAEQGIGRGEPFVSVNPASAIAIKQWSADNFAALMDILESRLGFKCVVVTANMSVAGQVMSHSTNKPANLAGRTGLKQLAAVLRRSAVHICGDTGSGHLASALGRPVIALIGPTDADRTCPYGQRDNIIRHSDLCGPLCSWRHCEFAAVRCMDAITPPEVAAKVERVLSVNV